NIEHRTSKLPNLVGRRGEVERLDDAVAFEDAGGGLAFGVTGGQDHVAEGIALDVFDDVKAVAGLFEGTAKFGQVVVGIAIHFFAFAPDLHFDVVASPFMADGEIFEHEMAELGVVVVALDVEVEAVYLEDDVVGLEDLFAAIRAGRDVDDDDSARFAGELEPI